MNSWCLFLIDNLINIWNIEHYHTYEMNLCNVIDTGFLPEIKLASESLNVMCRNPAPTIGNDESTVQHDLVEGAVISFF